jgi:hypothetical protein
MVNKKAKVTSSTAYIPTISAKLKAVQKGKIRKNKKGNFVIIVFKKYSGTGRTEMYFATSKAIRDVLNGNSEETPIFGY